MTKREFKYHFTVSVVTYYNGVSGKISDPDVTIRRKTKGDKAWQKSANKMWIVHNQPNILTQLINNFW